MLKRKYWKKGSLVRIRHKSHMLFRQRQNNYHQLRDLKIAAPVRPATPGSINVQKDKADLRAIFFRKTNRFKNNPFGAIPQQVPLTCRNKPVSGDIHPKRMHPAPSMNLCISSDIIAPTNPKILKLIRMNFCYIIL